MEIKKRAKRTSLDSIQLFVDDGIYIEERIIQFFGEIDEQSCNKVMKGIHVMLSKSKELPINIYLNSMGGDVYSAFGLYDFIENLPVEVRITVVGCAMSAATIILMAGDVRQMTKNSRLMLHTVSGGIDGKSFEIITDANEVRIIHEMMCDIYGKRSLVDRKKWSKDLKYENVYLSSEESLEKGLIDKVV
jgi:ATP-dependent Clp protease protease subunit